MTDEEIKLAEEAEAKRILALGKKVRKEKQTVINERTYEFIFPKHYRALEFIQFAETMNIGDKRFEMMSKELEKMTIFEKSTLDKLEDHWETHQSDFKPWLEGFLAGIASPFQDS